MCHIARSVKGRRMYPYLVIICLLIPLRDTSFQKNIVKTMSWSIPKKKRIQHYKDQKYHPSKEKIQQRKNYKYHQSFFKKYAAMQRLADEFLWKRWLRKRSSFSCSEMPSSQSELSRIRRRKLLKRSYKNN